MLVDAVLFDLDGTLVDSSASVERAWRAVAANLGVPYMRFAPHIHGIPAPQVFARVIPSLPPDEAERLSEEMLVEQAQDTADVVAAPGAVAALGGLPEARWAIVTSGDRRLATSRIRAAGLPMPAVLVTAEDVPTGKPDPACYLLAASQLGFVAGRCLVVEDAPAGVAAGRAAGMEVLALTSTYPDLNGTALRVPDLGAARFEADRDGVHVDIVDVVG